MNISNEANPKMINPIKIITWNCRGAYRKKQTNLLESFDPDIWIIQECEHPENYKKEKGFNYPENYVWHGENRNKGIGVFAKDGYKIEIDNCHNPDFKFIVPVNITGKYKVNLLAVWTKNESKERKKQRYISQLYCAVNYYKDYLKSNSIIVGDYNWNLIFDKNSYGLYGKFIDFLEQMDELHFTSAYHKYLNENFGEESTPTLYFRGGKDKVYHIDYMFLSNSLSQQTNSLIIGKWEDWHLFSDHMPIYLELINNSK